MSEQAEGYDPKSENRILGLRYGVTPSARQVAYAELGRLLEGFTEKDIRKIGDKAKLPREDIQILMANSAAGKQAEQVPLGLDPRALAVPGQTVLGAIVEGRAKQGPLGFDPIQAAKGAAAGATGSETYTGTAGAYTSYTGGTKKAGREFAKSLPAGVRIPADIVVETVVDPTSWVTLGYGAGAKTAAATVAKAAAGQAATDVVLNTAARTVFDDIARYGLRRGLARTMTVEQADELIKALPKTVQRQANKLRPGVYMAGKRVPGSAGTEAAQSRFLQMGPKSTSARVVGAEAVAKIPEESVAARAEQALRPRGATAQGVRAGILPPYSAEEFATIMARWRAGRNLASVAERKVQKEVAYMLGEQLRGPSWLGKDATERVYIRTGEKWLRDNPEALQRVYRALDVGGGPDAVARLNPLERSLAEMLDQVRRGTYEQKIELGRLQPYDEALETAQQQAARRRGIDQKIEKTSKKVSRQQEQAQKAAGRLEAAQTKLDEAVDADLAKAQAEVDARNLSRADALELKSIRQIQADNAKTAAGEFRAATEEVIGAERQFRAARAAARDAARPIKQITKDLKDAANKLKTATGAARERLQDRIATLEAQLQTATEQNNLLQSSLNDDLARASSRLDAAETAFQRAKTNMEAFAARQKPGDVSVPRRPGRARPQISKRQAKELQRYARLMERARVSAKEAEKLQRALTRLQARQAGYVANAEVVRPEEYLRRYPSREAIAERTSGRKAFGDKASGISGERPGYTRTRTIRGTPASDVVIKGTDEPLFELDPLKVVGRDAGDVVRDSTRINLVDQLRSRPVTIDGVDYPSVIDDPKLLKEISENTRSELSRQYSFRNMPVPRESQLADDIAEQLDILDPDEVEDFLNSLDEDLVKSFDRSIVNRRVAVHNSIVKDFDAAMKILSDKTALRAVSFLNALWARTGIATTGFISRNVLQGNLFLAMMAGALKPGDLPIWISTLRLFKRANRGLQRFGDFARFLTKEQAALFKQAMDEGVITTGFQDSIDDVVEGLKQGSGMGPKRLRRSVRYSPFSPLSPEFVAYKGIADANQWFENWSRLSVYRAKMRQGYASPEAAFITNKYMLNYQDLSRVNRGLRYISPFITWTYKVVPLITGTLLRDPKKIIIPERIIAAINREGIESEDIDLLPQWMREGQSLVLPKSIRENLPGPFKESPQVLTLDLPTATALRSYKLPRRVAEIFAGRPGATREAARELINLMQLGGTAGVAKSLAESGSGTSFFTGRQYQLGEQVPTPAPLVPIYGDTMSWEQYNILQSLSPILQRANLALPRGERAQETQARGLLSAILGINLYPYTKKTRDAEAYVRSIQLDALIRFMRENNLDVPSRSRTENETGVPNLPPVR